MARESDNLEDPNLLEQKERGVALPRRPVFVLVVTLSFAVGLGIAYWLTRPAEEGVTGDRQDDPGPVADVSPQPRPAQPTAEIVVEQEATGEINFSPSYATLEGGNLELQLVETVNQIVGWKSAGDSALWYFRVEKPAAFRVDVYYSADPEWQGGQYALQVDDEKPVLGEIISEGSTDQFRKDEEFVLVTRSGKHTLRLRPRHLAGDGLMVLRSIRLVPRRQASAQ